MSFRFLKPSLRIAGSFRKWVVSAALFLCIAGLVRSAFAQASTTTNSQMLSHFWSAVETGQKPFTVLSFGDSMADSFSSISYVWIRKLDDQFGHAGYALNNYRNRLLIQASNGARLAAPSKFWFTDHLELPAEGAVHWDSQYGGGVSATRLGLYYVAHPHGGEMELSVSTNLGAWTPKLTVDAQSADLQGRYTNIDLTLNTYRLRVVSKSGTNYVIGPQAVNMQTQGLQTVFADKGGIHLGHVTNVPLSIRVPIFAAIKPDLIIWAMKEDEPDLTHPRLIENEKWWAQAVPNADVLYIGTPWTIKDTTNTIASVQNELVRSIALTYNRAYVDCATPAVSYEWMVAQGYMADVIHVNIAGSTYRASWGWNELGLFALRQPRTLWIRPLQNEFKLGFGTGTNATYHVESSTNLVDWTETLSLKGTGGLQEATVAEPHSAAFRLRLTP